MPRCKYPRYSEGKEYIRQVLNGRIKTCKSVELAFLRHEEDLKKSKQKDYPFKFDPAKAERFINFGECLPQTTGEFYGVKFKAEPWQCASFAIEMGWVKKENGYRRFKQAFYFLPRKNGKSFIATLHALYFLLADGEPNAQIYCGATTEKQANHVFLPCKSIIQQSRALRNTFNIKTTQETIALLDGSSITRIVGSGGGDGGNPHLAILDEFHEHTSRQSYETMWRGMGNRRQPLLLMITTAGDNVESICKQKYDLAKRVLEGLEEQDNFFCMIYEADHGDDYYCLETVKKANPNFGISLKGDFLIDSMNLAKADISERKSYLTKQLNIWIASHTAYFNIDFWKKCANPDLRLSDYIYCFSKVSKSEIRRGAKLKINPKRQDVSCIIAVDLATRFDILAISYFFVKSDGKGNNSYIVFNEYFIPEETAKDRYNANNELYEKWGNTLQNSLGEGAKALNIQDGSETNLVKISELLKQRADDYNAEVILFDDWNATAIMQMLDQEGYNVATVGWSTKNLSPGMKDLKGAIQARRIMHDNNPVTNWMIGNVSSKTDNNGNEFPRKPDGQVNKKIDGACTLIMCCSYVCRLLESQLIDEVRR